jgi:anthranilate synthase/aminodeoxychorismate synthase-like glutamine amidotransferase
MGPRVLVVDNYDSFVYNLVQELGELGAEPVVYRNDAIDVPGIRATRPDAVLISPGPGRPEDGGVSLEAIRVLGWEIPVLGVCLGHQCIGQAYGGVVVAAPHLMHGKTSEIHHDGKGLFAGLPNPFVATRYHSLVVDPESVPGELEVTATSNDGVVMGLRHRSLPVEGVQFHPESVLTASGPALLANFLGQLGCSTAG